MDSHINLIAASRHATEGWYADPSGRLLMRYWNGAEWTLETRGNDSWTESEGDVGAFFAEEKPEAGWAGIAFALHSAMVCRQPATVSITLAPGSVITVNTFDQVYSWTNETAELPEMVSPAGVTFTPGNVSGTEQGRSLDGLLWRISARAFPDRLAPWLQADDLYRMQRWPNLTTINPELDDMRQAAMLANGMFTVDELAGFSDRSIPATRSLINALSLMNTLKVATPRAAGVFAPAQGFATSSTSSFGTPASPQQGMPERLPANARPPQKPGLFQRLRNRLGL